MDRLRIWMIIAAGLLFLPRQMNGQDRLIKTGDGADSTFHTLEYISDRYEFSSSVGAVYLTRDREDSSIIRISIPGYQPAGNPGGPEVPGLSLLFESGGESQVALEIEEIDSTIIDLRQEGISGKIASFRLSPSKGWPDRDPSPVRAGYPQNEWAGIPVLEAKYEGRMRGVDISSILFSPVRYLPERDLLIIYHRVEAVLYPGSDREKTAAETRVFEPLLRRIVRKDRPGGRKAVSADSPLTMVILSDTLFRKSLQPLVDWKTRKGFRVLEAYVQDPAVGPHSHGIREYLAQLYSAPPEGHSPPSYLLIVGDVQHVPLSRASGQVTDLYYATYDGEGDYIPDLFYGRISVESPGQLEGVLEKILDYEQYRFPDPSFLGKSVLIAGVDAVFAKEHGNGQIHYAGRYYLNEHSGNMAHSFFYPGSDTAGRDILDLISEGVGFVNYTGHGLSDRWINPSFHQEEVDDLQNLHRYPVMIGNGCETNVFHLNECFAEALLRAPGKGALAYIGCTNDSYWDEDYYWAVGVGPIRPEPLYEESGPGCYDRTFHLFGEPYPLWTPSLGEMVAGGNLSVQQSTSPRKKFYWEIYQLAGDPSLVPWFRVPDLPVVAHPQVIPPGSRRVDLICPAHSYAAFSYGGVLLDAAHAGAHGAVTLELPDSVESGDLDLVVTGPGHAPYTGKVKLSIPGDAYFSLLDHRLAAESVEPDGLVSPGEWFSLDMEWINEGNSSSAADTLVLRSPGADLEVVDSMAFIGPVGPGDTLRLTRAFRLRCPESANDMDPLVMRLFRKGAVDGVAVNLRERVVAPVLQSGGISWDDRQNGNGNGIAEPGEWLLCSWRIANGGHFRTGVLGTVEIVKGSGIFDQVISVGPGILQAGDTATVCFQARVGQPSGFAEYSRFGIAADGEGMISDSLAISPGRHREDFSEGRLDRFPFINAGDAPWMPDPDVYRSRPLSVRSGKVPNHGESRLSVEVEADRTDTLSFWYRVSSEQGYDFLQFFVDSSLAGRWSGETGWKDFKFIIYPGIHKLAWSYTKDQSVSRGEDAAWIDDIVFNGSAFRQHDLSLAAILEPRSGPWIGREERVSILIKNTGMDTVHGCTVSFGLDGYRTGDTLGVSLVPGQELTWKSEDRFDLSELKTYEISATVGTFPEQFMGNNSLRTKIHHYRFPDLSLRLEGVGDVAGNVAEAFVELTNTGNIMIDTLRYGIWIDDTLATEGGRPLHLLPGESSTGSFLLAAAGDPFPGSGIHEFRIRSLTPDSILSNNGVRGTFQWHAVEGGTVRSAPVVEVYPNPSGHGFRISFQSSIRNPVTLELVRSDGRQAMARELGVGTRSVFVPSGSLDAGLFFLRIESLGISIPVVLLP